MWVFFVLLFVGGIQLFLPIGSTRTPGLPGSAFARISWGRFGEQGLGMPAKQPGPSELRVPFSQWRPRLACREREQRAGLREGSLTTLQFLNVTYWSPRDLTHSVLQEPPLRRHRGGAGPQQREVGFTRFLPRSHVLPTWGRHAWVAVTVIF